MHRASLGKCDRQPALVKLQIVTLAAKLFVLSPLDRTLGLLSRYVLSLARYDSNYDVRDRARVITALLAGITTTPLLNGTESEDRGGVVLRREQVKMVLFDGKSSVVAEEFDSCEHLFHAFRAVTDPHSAAEESMLVPLPLSQTNR